jgi:Flp pilus assembly protein TadB
MAYSFAPGDPLTSHSFKTYRFEEKIEPATLYERWCCSVPKWAEIPVPFLRKKFEEWLKEALLICTPEQVFTMSFYSLLFAMLGAVFIITSLPSNQIILGVCVIFPLIVFGIYYLYPGLKIRMDRMAIVGEAPLAILYLVISLRVSPSLEKAVSYASKNVPEPIGRQFKFLMWDVEMKSKVSMQEALLSYSAKVKPWAPGYSEAIYLVANSVTEPSNKSRLSVLEKAMSQVLESTKSIMENFARGLGLPVAVTNAMAVLLPILGLVLAPLASIFMKQSGALPAMLFILYDFFLPFTLIFIVLVILSGRPATFSDIDLSGDPDIPRNGYYRLKSGREVPLVLVSFAIFLALSFVTLSIAVSTGGAVFFPTPAQNIGSSTGYTAMNTLPLMAALGISVGLYFYANNIQKMKGRAKILEMEREFASGLYQLGNILEQGKPMEEGFEIAARSMRGTHTADFFNTTVRNVRQMGLPLRKAIFDPKSGSMKRTSSTLMRNVLGVIIESADSGPIVAAQTTLSISSYIKNIQAVQDKISDNLSDSVTAMKFQTVALVPLISAVIVGLTQMVTNILLAMSKQMSDLMTSGGDMGGMYALFSADLFNIGNVMQGSYLQAVVGFYTLLLLGTLGFFVAGLSNGAQDRIAIETEIGNSLLVGTITYSIIVMIIVAIFGGLVGRLVGGGVAI